MDGKARLSLNRSSLETPVGKDDTLPAGAQAGRFRLGGDGKLKDDYAEYETQLEEDELSLLAEFLFMTTSEIKQDSDYNIFKECIDKLLAGFEDSLARQPGGIPVEWQSKSAAPDTIGEDGKQSIIQSLRQKVETADKKCIEDHMKKRLLYVLNKNWMGKPYFVLWWVMLMCYMMTVDRREYNTPKPNKDKIKRQSHVITSRKREFDKYVKWLDK